MDKLKIEIYPPRPNHMRTIYELAQESRAHSEAAREAITAVVTELPKPSANPLYHQDPLPPDEDTVPTTPAAEPENKIEEKPQEEPFVWKRK